MISDVTGITLAGQALQASEARFRQMAQYINEIFFLFEKEGNKPLYISPAVYTIFGVTEEMVYADSSLLVKAVHRDDAARVKFLDPDQFYVAPTEEEFRIITHSDGIRRCVRVRSFIISDEKGDVQRVAGVIEDISDLRRSQVQAQHQQQLLLQADKMASLGVLVSGIAHEINNPNNLIMFNADLVNRMFKYLLPALDEHTVTFSEEWNGVPTYEDLRTELPRLMKGISIGSQRIRNIALELKEFARTDPGRLDQEVRINDIVRSALSIVGNLISKSTDHFSVEYDATVPVLRGNIQQLEQVIINLLTNACQALPDVQRAIHVRTETDATDRTVSVVVADEGVGIPQENMQRLFDPFFSTKREKGGTGLGLSISYNIAKAHGGRIHIDSVDGKGCTATLRLYIDTAEKG